MSSLLFPSKSNLVNRQSLTSTVMPLTKHSAQLTSKNNNQRVIKIKRQESNSISSGK